MRATSHMELNRMNCNSGLPVAIRRARPEELGQIMEIVADAAIISKLADMTLFIVRAGLLDRSMLPEIEKFYTDKKYKNMALILNGTDGGSGRYGYKYGYKYGYHYGYAGYTKEE